MNNYLTNIFEDNILNMKVNAQKIKKEIAISLLRLFKIKFSWTDYPMNAYVSENSYKVEAKPGDLFEINYSNFLKNLNNNKIIYVVLEPNIKEDPSVYIFNRIDDFLNIRESIGYDFLFTIIDIEFSYLLCENSHDMIIGIGEECKDLLYLKDIAV